MFSRPLQHIWLVKSKKRNVQENTIIITLENQGFLVGNFSNDFAYDFAVFSNLSSEFEYRFVDNVTTICILTFMEDDLSGGYLDELFSLLIADNETEPNS